MVEEIRPAVVLVTRSFIVRKRRVLMLQRSSRDRRNPSRWEAPGGKLDGGQDLQDCLEREVIEEAGLLVRPIDNITYFDSRIIGDGNPYNGMTYVVLFGISHIIGGEIRLSNEHDAYRWCSYERMIGLALTPETRKAAMSLERRLRVAGVE